jgi:peptidoglycan pentaglycine glycine transferase (the first glycine)
METEKFLKKNSKDGGFLQSKHWADFKRKEGTAVFEFGDDNSRILTIKNKLPIVGSYWYVPRGPVFQLKKTNYDSINGLINEALKQKIGWIRVEPQREECLEVIKNAAKEHGSLPRITKSKKNHEPAQTLMVNLKESEEEILGKMKPKTRYNIRLSEKKGVKIFESKDKKDIEKFCNLIEQTARRDKIRPHPREHYRKMLKEINSDIIKLYLASFNGKVIAGAMIIFFGEVATYLHGASSDEDRNVMAPYGLHWRIMKKAKENGIKKYDLGATKLVRNKNSYEPEKGNWQGITRFKLGFSKESEPTNFPGCWDIVLDEKRYSLYKILQFLKGLVR